MNGKTEPIKYLINKLWTRYCQMVPAAQRFKEFFLNIGLSSAIDHIAFRTTSIDRMARIWEWFGYQEAGKIPFPKKKLNAKYYAHPDESLPLVFISEFDVDRLSEADAKWARENVAYKQYSVLPCSACDFWAVPMERFVDFFLVNPFDRAVSSEDLSRLDVLSEYLSWVRLFGNLPNHFTVAVHKMPGTIPLDIKQLSEKMAAWDIAMTGKFEGQFGSKLCQTSTEAAEVDVPVTAAGGVTYVKRKYAYMELAERKPTLFQGFLGEQAANLFDVTNK